MATKPKKSQKTEESYDQMQWFDSQLAAIRGRPAMYIGSTTGENGKISRAQMQLFQEALSNSVDEIMQGYGEKVTVTINKDESLTVADEGRGIPKDYKKKDDYIKVINAFTQPHASGKFNSNAYESSGGTNGIGMKAITATSDWVKADVVRTDGAYSISFEMDKVTSKSSRKRKRGEKTGTSITFLPSLEVFENITWSLSEIKRKLDSQAYLTPGATLVLIDNRGDEPQEFVYRHENGMSDLVDDMAGEEEEYVGMTKPLQFKGFAHFNSGNAKRPSELKFTEITDERPEGGVAIGIDIALAYDQGYNENVATFANGIPTRDGGPHRDGMEQAIVNVFRQFIADKKLMGKSKAKITPSDSREGLIAAMNVSIPAEILEFESQTKEKLGTTQAKAAVQQFLSKKLSEWVYDHEKEAKEIIEKIKDSKEAREAANTAREAQKAARKSKGKEKFELSTKLTTARSKDPKECELILVEGDSAGGSAKKARDSWTQAILPLRGKPLNVSGQKLKKVLSNTEMNTIISVLGAGVEPEFNIEDLQYDKIIIASDADVDGFHIRALLILAFWHLMPEIIRGGHLYIANPPLFRLDRYVNGKREMRFALDENELAKMQKEKDFNKYTTSRLKGLGEMDADQLKMTTLEKGEGKRRLTQVEVEDAKILTSKLDLLLGNKSKEGKTAAQRRYEWILEHVDFDDVEIE